MEKSLKSGQRVQELLNLPVNKQSVLQYTAPSTSLIIVHSIEVTMKKTISLFVLFVKICVFAYYVSALSSAMLMTMSTSLQAQAQALLAFKSKIIYDPNAALANWNLHNIHNLCSSSNNNNSWYGVTCTSDPPFKVISLDLYDMELTGNISVSICNLTSLTDIDLSGNFNLMGEIPPCLGGCTSLVTLNLSINRLSGHIPFSLANLSSLQELRLFNNTLVGEVPQGLSKCSRLRTLDLSYNELSGSIPSFLGNLSHLQYLALGKASHEDETDNLSGVIPPELGKLRDLNHLYIHGDNLEGSLPAEFENLTRLTWLQVNARKLKANLQLLPKLTKLQLLQLRVSNLIGKIPVEIGTLNSLVTLNLAGKVTGAGGIPKDICELTELMYFVLDHTEVGGQIPKCIANMTQLKMLELPGNRLHGELAGIFSNLSVLTILDLSSNAFSENIPEVGKLEMLYKLTLFHNSFRWPSKVEVPYSLEILSAHSNNFSGPLPESLGSCTGLVVLDLRNNRISGQLPYYLAKMKGLKILQLGYNSLEGFIPHWISNWTRLNFLDLSNNKFGGNISHTLLSIAGFQMRDVSYKVNADVSWIEKELELPRKYIPVNESLIDLSVNNLTGRIPSSIGILNGLRVLNLSHNMLEGKIPSSISNMSNLEELDLNSNQLAGDIPLELLELTFLSSFNVSNNLLCGSTPTGKQFNTFDKSSFQGNKCLCGYDPQHQCGLHKHVNGGENTKQEEAKKTWIDKIEDKVSIVAVGLGFGLAFGGTWALYFLWEPFQKFFGYLGM